MQAHNAEFWIRHLELKPHPEGGYFRETYRSNETIKREALPSRFNGTRSFSTAIYFLLRSGDYSHFHRIHSDELWLFHAGTTIIIYELNAGGVKEHHLGNNADRGETLQCLIPAGSWFGAKVSEATSYGLVSCTVSPGFDFADFEMADRKELLEQFPFCATVIRELTK